MPLISVVVPVYKVEPFLHQCVDSVLAQTFADFELILVDDGSPDNCGAMCDEYAKKDSRVRVLHKENGGLGNARNVGMDAALGNYIIFLDSDDYWDADTLERLYSEAKKNRLQLLLFSGEPFWDGMEQPAFYMDYLHSTQNYLVKQGPESLKFAREHHEYFSSACLRFYLLSYLRDNHFRFDEGIIHEDEAFSFLTYIFADRVECIGDRFYKRRYRPGSIMTAKSFQNSARGYGVAMGRLLDVYKNRSLDGESRLLFSDYIQMLLRSILRLFVEAYDLERFDKCERGTAREISRSVKEPMRKARVLSGELTTVQKISTHSLFLGYWYPRIHKKAKKVFTSICRLLRKIFGKKAPKE